MRVFFALWPDAAMRAALAELARDVSEQTLGRATPAENLHVTVAFVGDVARERIADLCAIGAAVAGVESPFTLTLDRTGTFRTTAIAWAGVTSMQPPLAQLAGNLNDALAAAGFAVERRPFTPHVTLARRCRNPVGAALAASIAWTVRCVALNASESRPGGQRYRELARWRFVGIG